MAFGLERALRSQLRVRREVQVEETEAPPRFTDLNLAPRVRNQVCVMSGHAPPRSTAHQALVPRLG